VNKPVDPNLPEGGNTRVIDVMAGSNPLNV
jgi:hypothetical protein